MRDDEKYSRMAMLTLGLAIGLALGMPMHELTWVAIFPGLLVPLSFWLDEKSVKFRNGVDYE